MSSDLGVVWLSRTSAFLAHYKVNEGTLTQFMIQDGSRGYLKHTVAFNEMTESKGSESWVFPCISWKTCCHEMTRVI